MNLSTFILLYFSAIAFARLTLVGQLFQLATESSGHVSNAKLAWSSTAATQHEVQRSNGNGAFVTVANVTGNSVDDYDLQIGTQYQYRIVTSSGTSNAVTLTPFQTQSAYESYDNIKGSSLRTESSISLNGVYYRYNYVTGASNSFYIQQQTSNDGYTFTGDLAVLTSDTICAPINTTCHLERVSFIQHPESNQVVMWAHLENTANYGLAQVACGYGTPGKTFEYAGTYRPLGHDSRDLTFWTDDAQSGNTGYLISSTNVNSDINIYQLTSNWTAIERLANKILVSQFREAPAMTKIAGTYYLFTSRAAGWYPSQPLVVSTKDVAGTWSAGTVPTDASTYSTQSGGLVSIGESSAMLADRWAANWSPPAGPNIELMLPLSFSPTSADAYSRYHWYQSVSYAGQGTTDTQSQPIFGTQSGKILSRSKPLSVTPTGGTNLQFVNDGIDNDPEAYFSPRAIPFILTVDLGAQHSIAEVDLATRMVQGSETYYQYTVIGSTDGTSFTQISSQEGNTHVGFSASFIQGTYRYIGVNVTRVINTHNGNEADGFVGVRELTVYGE